MKAYVLRDINQFQLEEVDRPKPGRKEVLVAVKAAGICGSDIPRIYKNGTYTYPLIPGHEFSGEVIETGDEVDSKWLGKRVGVYPLEPCFACAPCQSEKYEMCRQYNYLGSRTNGGFAEYVCVPEWNLIELKDTVSFETAAMLEPMAVAVHAIRRIEKQNIDLHSIKIAICGLGTIGLFLLMFLRERGITNIYAIGNKESQKLTTVQLGLKEERYCDSKIHDPIQWLRELTGGIDLYFDCVGKNEMVKQAMECCTPGGYVMLLGNPISDISLKQKEYWKILRNQLTLLGTWNSSFFHKEADDWNYILHLLETERVNPNIIITHRYNLEQLIYGFEIMRDKKENYIKILWSR